MFSFREQPKFFCTVSAALQHSFSGRQKMAGFRRMQTKTSLLSPSRHLLIQNVFSAYYQNCNNLNLKLDNTTLSCNLKLKKALENVSIAKNLNIATKYHMLGLKIFVQVQTFWRRPFVPSHNFCHSANQIFFSFSLSVLLNRILNSETRMMLTCGKDKKPM